MEVVDKFLNLEERVVLVTGANGQIGLSLIKSLLDYGAKVIAVDIKVKNIIQFKKNNKINDKRFIYAKCDIKKSNEVKKIFSYSKIKFREN